MRLKKYDNKKVRFIDSEKNIIEGISEYYTKEMSECMYGINSECLKITCFLFRKKEIKDISIIDEFSAPYGKIEKWAVEDGMDLVDEVLYSGAPGVLAFTRAYTSCCSGISLSLA